jgi:hypothetical protein
MALKIFLPSLTQLSGQISYVSSNVALAADLIGTRYVQCLAVAHTK